MEKFLVLTRYRVTAFLTDIGNSNRQGIDHLTRCPTITGNGGRSSGALSRSSLRFRLIKSDCSSTLRRYCKQHLRIYNSSAVPQLQVIKSLFSKDVKNEIPPPPGTLSKTTGD